MKQLGTILLSLACLALSAQSIDSAKVIKFMSYNILHGATLNGDFDLDRIAEVIRKEQPDLVSLQEVDFRTVRAKKYDLATELGQRLGMAPLFGRAMYYDSGEYGEGILSRFTFLSTRNIPLPYTEGMEPRAALEATVLTDSGDTISFIGTHLDHTRDPKNRIMQARAINDAFTDNPYPTVLSGDLNDVPDSEAIRILLQNWVPSSDLDAQEYTFSSSSPNKKIDYILFRDAAQWEVLETRVICDKIASDHCAILATLLLRK